MFESGRRDEEYYVTAPGKSRLLEHIKKRRNCFHRNSIRQFPSLNEWKRLVKNEKTSLFKVGDKDEQELIHSSGLPRLDAEQ